MFNHWDIREEQVTNGFSIWERELDDSHVEVEWNPNFLHIHVYRGHPDASTEVALNRSEARRLARVLLDWADGKLCNK